jgi:hypothetical protein
MAVLSLSKFLEIISNEIPLLNTTNMAAVQEAVSSIYNWSENSSPKSEASFVFTAHTKTIERD